LGGADIRKGVTGFDYYLHRALLEVPGVLEGYKEIIHSSEYNGT